MGMTTEDNFWNILQSAYDQQSDKKYTIKEIMKSWLTQNHYPVLYVNNDRIAKEIKLKAVGANNYVSKWIIPVTCTMQLYRNKVSTSNVTWINSSEITNIRLSINYDLVIINASQSGKFFKYIILVSLPYLKLKKTQNYFKVINHSRYLLRFSTDMIKNNEC